MVTSTLLLAKAAMSVNLQNFCALKLDASGICEYHVGKVKISVGKTEIAAAGKGEINY